MVSGAIGGLDAIAAAAVGIIEDVTITSRKPPRGLAGGPYLEANGVDLSDLTSSTVVFEGSARDVCRGFPANVNANPRAGVLTGMSVLAMIKKTDVAASRRSLI